MMAFKEKSLAQTFVYSASRMGAQAWHRQPGCSHMKSAEAVLVFSFGLCRSVLTTEVATLDISYCMYLQ